MQDPFSGRRMRRRLPRLIEIDAFVDTSLFRIGVRLLQHYERYTVFMRRFRTTGLKRCFYEVVSEGATLGVAGLLVMLAFARPALEIVQDDDWRNNAELSVTFLDRTGNVMGRRGILHSDVVPLEEMPEHLIKATLATEDRRFYEHFGIDVAGTIRALATNLRANSVVEGGSSITQQLAKNLFLTNERTLERKIKEAFLSLWLEANFTKDEILKLYLDRAYLGGGAFGVEAAARFYFGKSVRDLNLAEAAMMAGLFKAPTRYAPHVNLPAARARASEVLTNLVQSHFMTEGEVLPARRNPASAVPREGEDAPNYYLDWAFQEVKRLRTGNDTVLTVRTTFDPALQTQADNAVVSSLRQYGQRYGVKQAAMVVTEPDGAVLAMVGGRDYSASQFNRASVALRQPGSSFKPYVYAAALQHGFTPESVVVDGPVWIAGWSPQNYGRSFRGRVRLITALAKSINTIPVKLGQAMGRDKIIKTAKKMGVRTPLRDNIALALGTSELTVLDQAGGYAVFANGGMKVTPYGIVEIRNSQDEIIYSHARDAPPQPRALPVEVVKGMNLMLHEVVVRGTGRRAQIPGVIVNGKTGTSQSYRDAWFVGYTGNYVAAVWFGNDNFSPMRRLTGGRIPAMTWQRVMAYAHQGIDPKPIPYLDVEPPEGKKPAASADSRQDEGPRRPLLISGRTRAVLNHLEQRFTAAKTAATATSGRSPGDETGAVPEAGEQTP